MSDGKGLWDVGVKQLGFYDSYDNSGLSNYSRELFFEGVRNFKKKSGGVLMPAVQTNNSLESFLEGLWNYLLVQCRNEIVLEGVVALLKKREREIYESGERSKDFSYYEQTVEENKKWLEQKKKELENYPESYLSYMEWMRANVNNYKPFWMNNRYKNFSNILKEVIEQEIEKVAKNTLPDKIYEDKEKRDDVIGILKAVASLYEKKLEEVKKGIIHDLGGWEYYLNKSKVWMQLIILVFGIATFFLTLCRN